MSSTSRAWIVATSVGMVEALKDQGLCRWNYTMRTLHQHAKKLSPKSSSLVSTKSEMKEKTKQAEESLRKVMYLSCWGPN
ncbi:unnamed protein product [Withania somnifera]